MKIFRNLQIATTTFSHGSLQQKTTSGILRIRVTLNATKLRNREINAITDERETIGKTCLQNFQVDTFLDDDTLNEGDMDKNELLFHKKPTEHPAFKSHLLHRLYVFSLDVQYHQSSKSTGWPWWAQEGKLEGVDTVIKLLFQHTSNVYCSSFPVS